MDDSTAGNAEGYYKVTEAAVLLKVARNTVYALIAAGDLTAIRVSNSLRISPAAVDAYLSRKAMVESDEMLTIDEVARKLRIGKRTVESLIASGELESVKVASMRRVSPEALEQYLKKYALIAADDLTDAYLGRKETAGADVMLTIDEVARRLRIGRRTVGLLIASGELESVKVASMRRVSPEALEQYLKAARRAGAR